MGFLDKLVDAAKTIANERTQGQGGQAQAGQGAQEKSLIEGVVDMFKGEGVNGMVQRFREKGLEETVKSWIGTGANQNITANQVRDVVGQEKISQLAGQTGMSEEKVATVLTEVLPDAVDRATPDGKMDDFDPDQKR